MTRYLIYKYNTSSIVFPTSNCLFILNKMEKPKAQIKHSLLYEYQLGHKAREAALNICHAIGLGSVSNVTVSNWFKPFDEKN
jgi:hypothetical protein